GHDAKQRRLATARRPEQSDHVPRLRVERDLIERAREGREDLDDALGDQSRAHPFTAPRVSPETIRRWNTSTRKKRGRLASVIAAHNGPQGISYNEAPETLAMPAVTVLAWSRVRKVTASMNSFHAKMKTRMPAVTIAGAASGAITRTRRWGAESPSRRAA